ncbi:hypothetical protein B566_EDAN013686 [Ephemera danica]|nr:hypothetical protein B566_EDAN013686 [Ephemera danica]
MQHIIFHLNSNDSQQSWQILMNSINREHIGFVFTFQEQLIFPANGRRSYRFSEAGSIQIQKDGVAITDS